MPDDDLLANIKQEMQARLKELQPAVDEYRKIETALRQMEHKRPGRPRKVETDS